MNSSSTDNDIPPAFDGVAGDDEKREIILRFLKKVSAVPEDLASFRATYDLALTLEDPDKKSSILLKLIILMPVSGEFVTLYNEIADSALELTSLMEKYNHRKSAVMRIAVEIPEGDGFSGLYSRIMEEAIRVSDKIDDKVARRSSLIDISDKLEKREGFAHLSLHALEVGLGLAGDNYRNYSLKEIAKELPKTCDYSFYRKHTFFGITLGLKKEGKFLDLYKKAMDISISSADEISEPYYRQYALMFIVGELPKSDEFHEMYKKALTKALDAMLEMKDKFGRQQSLLDIFRAIPKRKEFYDLILKIIENSLTFFSVKSRIKDLEALDVIDYIIVAEEKKLTDSKKLKYGREKYADHFAKELEKNIDDLKDIRILGVLKPYDHVWTKPESLRSAIKNVSARLTSLMEEYHGKEIERPMLLKKDFFDYRRQSAPGHCQKADIDTISIDLGATNTVIMRKRGGGSPEFIELGTIADMSEGYCSVPTLIDVKTGVIGAEVIERGAFRGLKKRLLEGAPDSYELMEKYLLTLYRYIRNGSSNKGRGGLFSIFSGKSSEMIYITVPVGFEGYRESIARIMKPIAKGVNVELIEEPLAAAIGYQVAEKKDKLIMIFDFGGCTLDIILIRANVNELHVVAKPDRSKILGGDDIDLWLVEYMAEQLGLSKEDTPSSLLPVAESIKITLSEHMKADFEWEGNKICEISRDDLESIMEAHDFYTLVDKEISYVLGNSRKVGVDKDMIEGVVITGGSSLIPSFKDKIGDSFPDLRRSNAIYDHSPLAAVAEGAVMYGSSDIADRHLGIAYALKYVSGGGEKKFDYEIVLEKGDPLPFEKTLEINRAQTLGAQTEIYLEFFEIPDRSVSRRWVKEAGAEYIKQILKQNEKDIAFKALKIVTLPVAEDAGGCEKIILSADETGWLKIRYGSEGKQIDSHLRLQ